MNKYKNILPGDTFHIITKGITCEICVTDNNVANFTKFSDFLQDNLIVDVHYCYAIHCILHDDCLFILTGGFKLRNSDLNDIEMLYNNLISSFIKSYSGKEIVNYINVSFHPYNSIIMFKYFKSKLGL